MCVNSIISVLQNNVSKFLSSSPLIQIDNL
uniref:Uncharacterized protein n=1 Tax=Anguilla anguilla TaxID=7936 RepID=A0A0E9UM93_ANGAN